MKLYEFIDLHAEDLLDLPEEPETEDFEFCRFHADSSWYGYSEESGMNEEAYEEAMREYEAECERVRSECEFKDSDLYLWVDEQRIEDFDEIRTYLDREIERAEGYEVWIA